MAKENEPLALDELYLRTVIGPVQFCQMFDPTEVSPKMVRPLGVLRGMYNSQMVSRHYAGRTELMQVLQAITGRLAAEHEVTLPNGVTCTIEELREALKYVEEVETL